MYTKAQKQAMFNELATEVAKVNELIAKLNSKSNEGTYDKYILGITTRFDNEELTIHVNKDKLDEKNFVTKEEFNDEYIERSYTHNGVKMFALFTETENAEVEKLLKNA